MNDIMRRVLLYILGAMVLFPSCVGRNGAVVPPETHLVDFTSTKVEADGRTYKVFLNGIPGTTTANHPEYSGTYHEAGGVLQPCSVDNNGVFIEEDSSKGLRAANGPYKMYIVSPAIDKTAIDGTSLSGYMYDRNQEGVYISKLSDVEVSGVYIQDAHGDDCVYDAQSDTLVQHRSRLKVIFACGADIESTTLYSVSLKNIIDKGYYIPAQASFYYEDSDIVDEPLYSSDPKSLVVGEEFDLNVDQYILSMDYSEKTDGGNNRWPLPSLEIKIGESGGKTFTADMGFAFEPQHTYVIRIVINSNYLGLTVDISDWDNGGGGSSSVDGIRRWSFKIPVKDGDNNVVLEWDGDGNTMQGEIV